MPKIKITNPRNVIEAPIKKNYFKIRATSGPKGDKGDTGATGPQGPQGPQGNAATIYVGSTTTLPVGQDATVENVGSQYAAVLNFGIPQGPQGPQGAKGDKGDKGDKGEQGNTGNTGPAGQNATVYIGTTTTGAPGSQASVYNSGTENNAVLNFTIPQGAKGDTGATGATGPQGPAGQDGKDFAPSVVDSLPAVGEENKLYLTPKAHTTQTATGNPITATITDDAGQIEDFQLDGDTYQQSYSGKNLFEYIPAAQAAQGLISTIDSNGVVTVTGTGTARWSDISQYSNNASPSGTYTITVATTGTGTLPRNISLRIGDNDNANLQTITLGINESVTETLVAHTKWRVFLATDADVVYDCKIKIQVEVGSTATSYEPFVGGIASPNPSYPQPIQAVTGEQTVEVIGKNLFDKTTEEGGWLNNTGGISQPTSTSDKTSAFITAIPNTAYTLSSPGYYLKIAQYDSSKTFIKIDSTGNNIPSNTITTESNTAYIRISYGNAQNQPNVMLEISSTATTYTPFRKQTFPLDLGSIELCKLGTYQDYIYKDGDTWKVHKAMGKVLIDGTVGTISNPSTNRFNLDNTITDYKKQANSSFALCDQYISIGQTDDNAQFNTNASGYECCINFGSATASVIRFKNTKISTSDDFADALEAHPLTMYYALATATDTEITDATLISQLNAIASASLETGTNTLTNSATGSNLAGDMEVDYFGYDPTNRYDKWLWLDINNAYEKLGS